MRTVAIIQARMTSTRLPGKIMADVGGQPLLRHVVARARRAQRLDVVAVATTTNQLDDDVERFCRAEGIRYFRGSELDVLDRYYRAAEHFGAEAVVRLTSDCPLLDPLVIDQVMEVFAAGDYDYVSNTLEPTFPDGLDTEVFWREALARAWRETRLPSEREHVTPYVWKHPALFRLGNVRHDPPLGDLRWTVDEPQDLDFVRAIYQHLGPEPSFGMREVLRLLEARPDLCSLNNGIGRNEGYLKSVREEASS